MDTHDQLVKKLMRRPGVRAEVERIEREESALLDALLKARQEAGLTQGQVAARMGTHAPAIARLERALASGKHSPSISTLRKYVKACGMVGAPSCMRLSDPFYRVDNLRKKRGRAQRHTPLSFRSKTETVTSMRRCRRRS